MTPRRHSIYVDEFAHVNPIPAAARIGNLIFSGVITGRDPRTGRPAATLQEQTAQMFAHLRSIVERADATTDDIVKITVWLADPSDRSALNAEWLEMFPDPDNRPARQAHAADLRGGVLVQCDFVAVVEHPPTS